MNLSLPVSLNHFEVKRPFFFSVILFCALLSFEVFNYSTTVFALEDLLGNLRFIGIRWATILAFAFCGIDFAGIARLFTPNPKKETSRETWLLFWAWLLAASMNAVLTWWGVSLAILNHQTLGNEVVERSTLLTIVPIFIAIIIWLIRVLIIGTFSTNGGNFFYPSNTPTCHNKGITDEPNQTNPPIDPNKGRKDPSALELSRTNGYNRQNTSGIQLNTQINPQHEPKHYPHTMNTTISQSSASTIRKM